MRDVVCFDLDSTIADTLHRQWMVEEIKASRNKGPTWEDYSLACSDDKPIEGTIALTQQLKRNWLVFIVTGRSSAARELTEDWLSKHQVAYDGLLMRPAGDRTPNGQYKIDVINQLRDEGYKPVLFVEDFPEAAEEIRKATGVPVLLVNPGYPDDAPHSNGAPAWRGI